MPFENPVMGGEDWAAWVETLRDADLLADGFREGLRSLAKTSGRLKRSLRFTHCRWLASQIPPKISRTEGMANLQ